MFSIGNLRLPSSFILAPMSGISDLPFRLISRDFGCPLAFAEMVSARALVENNRKTLKLLKTSPSDRPLGIQLLVRDPEFLAGAIELLDDYCYDVLDLNAACPVRKVTRKGEGAALLKDPERLVALVKTAVKYARIPVTVKIRSGWDHTSINACDIAVRIADAGADAVCIHGRTKEQGYGGKADPDVIRDVKESVKIPVIASGDIFSSGAAKRVMAHTGCDAIMVARGALGNPWIFEELTDACREEAHPRPTLNELKTVMKRHLALSVESHGDLMGVVNFRKFFVWYVKGLRKARLLRSTAVRMSGVEEMMRLIDGLGTTRSPGLSPQASQASPCGRRPQPAQAPSP